jgi:hypothetical protein
MKEYLEIFLTHFDDYLDTCLCLNGDDGFDNIRQMKYSLNAKRKEISLSEYHKQEAEIFCKYLKMINII